MADQTQTILIDVKVEASAALQRQTELKAALEAVKKEQAELAKTVGVSSEAYIRNEAQIKNLNNQILNNSKIIQANEQQINTVDGAYRKLNDTYLFAAAKAKDLAAAYGANDARTKEAVATAKQYSDQLKAVDASVGQNQRNVGNYSDAIKGLNGNMINNFTVIKTWVTQTGGLSGAFGGAKTAVQGFGKQLLALLANPVLAIIAGIVSVFLLLKNAVSNNGEATKKLNIIMQPFKVLIEAVGVGLGKLASVLLDGVMAVGKFIGVIASFIPGLSKINDLAKESIDLKKEEQALSADVRNQLVSNAKNELAIAELKNKAKQKDKYTNEQRLAFLKQSDALEIKMNKEKVSLAIRAFELYKKQMAERGQTFRDLTKEEKQAYKQMEADIYNTRKEYFQNTIRIKSQTANAVKEMEAEEQARQEKIRENNVKAQDKQLAKLETNLAIYQEKNKTMTAKNLKDIEEMEMTILKKKLSFGKITQEEYTLEKLQIEQKYSEGVISLAKKTADKAVEQMNYEFELYKLKEQERLAGQKLTDEQLHKNKLDGLQKEYKTELDKLGERLDSEEITLDEYNKQVVLLNQQKNTNIALENADFDAKQLERKKQALAIEAQAEFDLKQLQYQNQFDAERAALDAQYQQQIDAANKVGADTTALTAIYEKQKTKIAEKENEARFNVLSNVAGNLAELFGKETALGKAAASAQVAIQTYQGAMSAWTAAQVFPAPFNSIVGAASVAATTALGIKNIDSIWAVKAEGINSGSGGGSKPSMSVPSITGGIVNRQSGQIEQSAQRRATSDALAEQPREVVLVTNDLTTALNEKTSLKVENSI